MYNSLMRRQYNQRGVLHPSCSKVVAQLGTELCTSTYTVCQTRLCIANFQNGPTGIRCLAHPLTPSCLQNEA